MNIASIISRNYAIIPEEATLSEVIGKIKAGQSSILIFSGKNFMGIPDQRKFLKVGLDVSQAKVKHFMQSVPIITETEELNTAAEMLERSQTELIPVEKKGQIIGVITALAIIEAALAEMPTLIVNDIELIKPTGIEKEDTIAEAISVMINEKVDHLPVMDGDTLYGILSYHDFMQKYLLSSPQREQSTKFGKMSSSSRGGKPSAKMTSVPVSSISTNQNLLTILPDSLLQKALQNMKQYKVNDLIVMQGKEFKGLLLTRKILQKIVAEKSSATPDTSIQFIGLHDTHLEKEKIAEIKGLAEQESEKVLRHVPDGYTMILHVKEYSKTGKKHKYSIHLRLEFPGKIISAHQDDWDIIKALRITFEHAQNEVQREFHSQRDKERRKKREKRTERF